MQGLSAFEIDVAALAHLQPGLVLTQDACATCDADAGSVQAALQRAGLLGPSARTPAFVLTLAPRTLAAALDNILQVGCLRSLIQSHFLSIMQTCRILWPASHRAITQKLVAIRSEIESTSLSVQKC